MDGRTPSPTGAFVAAGDRWRFTGALVFDDAMDVVRTAASLPLPASGVVDLSELAHGDSSALAVLLALRRRAQAEGHRGLTFPGMPAMLDALARVYGVESLVAG